MGISTKLFSNKGKVLLTFISRRLVRKSNRIAKLAKDKKDLLGNIKYKRGDGIDVLDATYIESWSQGVNKIIKDPDVQIDTENYFKSIVEENEGKDIPEDAREAYDEVCKRLKDYEDFREAIKTYSYVINERSQVKKDNRFSLFIKKYFGGDQKALNEGTTAQNEKVEENNVHPIPSIIDDLQGEVISEPEPEIIYSNSDHKVKTIHDKDLR